LPGGFGGCSGGLLVAVATGARGGFGAYSGSPLTSGRNQVGGSRARLLADLVSLGRGVRPEPLAFGGRGIQEGEYRLELGGSLGRAVYRHTGPAGRPGRSGTAEPVEHVA